MAKAVCVRGHDTELLGRYPSGHCSECRRGEAAARARAKQASGDPSYKAANAERARLWRNTATGINSRWERVGITIEGRPFTTVDYDRAYQVQGGCCAACGKHQSEIEKRLHADHDHLTGEFRWLLCVKCNLVLGYVNDSPELLEKIAAMLRERV